MELGEPPGRDDGDCRAKARSRGQCFSERVGFELVEQLLPRRRTKLIYLRAALIFSSIPAPGHCSFSESLLNGVSTVLRWAWRSSELVSRYSRPVTTSPFAAWWATYSSACTRSVGS